MIRDLRMRTSPPRSDAPDERDRRKPDRGIALHLEPGPSAASPARFMKPTTNQHRPRRPRLAAVLLVHNRTRLARDQDLTLKPLAI